VFHLCGTCESLSINNYYIQVICLSFQTLPDQQHCYFMTESKNLEGILVSNIPFSHPAHVPQILVLLRQQALFNVLVSSCIRSASKHGMFCFIFLFQYDNVVDTVIITVFIVMILTTIFCKYVYVRLCLFTISSISEGGSDVMN